MIAELDDDERGLLDEDMRFHVLHFSSNGGIIMPIPLELTYDDGSVEELMLPADLWRRDPHRCSTLLIRPGRLTQVRVDPHDEIADAVRDDNVFPPAIDSRRFRLRHGHDGTNPMREARTETARAVTHERMVEWAANGAAEPDAIVQLTLPMDGWGHPLAMQLPTVNDVDVLVRLISAGADHTFGTPDDLSAAVSHSGDVAPLRMAAERPVIE